MMIKISPNKCINLTFLYAVSLRYTSYKKAVMRDVRERGHVIKIITFILIVVNITSCSILEPKFVGYEYKEYSHDLGCRNQVLFGPRFEYKIQNNSNSKVLVIYAGRVKSKGTGYTKHRQKYEKYQDKLSWPPRYYRKYIGTELIERKEGMCGIARIPGESKDINIRIKSLDMAGTNNANKDGLVAIDLMEPAILSGMNNNITVEVNALVEYKSAFMNEGIIRERIYDRYIVDSSIVNELIINYKNIKNGKLSKNKLEAILDVKYIYDQYGNIQLSKELFDKVEEAKWESKRKRIPIRETKALKGMAGLLRTNLLGFLAEILFDAITHEYMRKIIFVQPPNN